jgi:hypothetical protein
VLRHRDDAHPFPQIGGGTAAAAARALRVNDQAGTVRQCERRRDVLDGATTLDDLQA